MEPIESRRASAHKSVARFASHMHLPRDVQESIERARPAAEVRSVWCIETEVWWERRLFRFKGALESERDRDEICFGSLRLPAEVIPERWSLAFERPEAFQS